MKVMVIVKASKDSEAGKMPSTELLAAMGKYNEELVKAGIMLSGEGLHPSSRAPASVSRARQAHRYRRPLCRDEGADRRVLDVACELDAGGDRLGKKVPESDE